MFDICCGGVSIDSVLFVLHTLLNYSLSLWTLILKMTLLFYYCVWKPQTYVTRRSPWTVSKNTKLGAGGRPTFWQLWVKVQTLDAYTSAPKRYRDTILVLKNAETMAELKF